MVKIALNLETKLYASVDDENVPDEFPLVGVGISPDRSENTVVWARLYIMESNLRILSKKVAI